ncbi:MAG: AMIN domain-containing protein [Symploca sp. SIO3C6]|nr:AMIN domain-containing protein [Symploca sp. SIO3C6]
MRQAQQLSGILAIAAVTTLVAPQPVRATSTMVTGVQVNPNGTQLQVILETQAGDERPQIFAVNRGNDWVADIVNTGLNLKEGDSLRYENPMSGITAVAVNQLAPNTIRITVSGDGGSPEGQILQQGSTLITLGITPAAKNQTGSELPGASPLNALEPATVAQTPTAEPEEIPTAEPIEPESNQTPPPTEAQIEESTEEQLQEEETAQPPPEPEVLFPEPEIIIEGVPASPATTSQPVAPTPPFLPRAVAPPVGDIAISNINVAASRIDLGTGARVPRLVLREAPVREVLALLARAADLNLAFAGGGAARGRTAQGAPPAAAQQTISLDLEDEPVQDVFNYVLQLSGLEANRIGRTIFVGSRLPDATRNLISRTLRLNQVTASQAAGFLSAQGAETQRVVEEVTIQTVGEGAAARTVETRDTTIEPLAATEGEGPLLLKGLSVLTDERLNAVMMVGDPRKVEIASSFLLQLDARRRQVAVNVKIVDVDLSGQELFNTSFSFGIDDTFFSVDEGAAVVNFGEFRPPTNLDATTSLTSRPVIANPFSGANTFVELDDSISIPGTSPGEIVLDERDGTIVRRQGRGSLIFQRRNAGVSGDPLDGGITNIDLAEDTEITIDSDGEFSFSLGDDGEVDFGLPSLFQYPSRFLATLEAQVISGNAKILTDPTLVVQEGETANVNLVQEVVGNISSETDTSDGLTTRTITAEIEEAGLILEITVDRIDDNGFVSLRVNPTVTSIGSTQDLSVGDDTNQIALLNRRDLQSGLIRLRDGQTLILSGIIQETDRTTVSKVPILGDLPIIGALFRSTDRENERNEVIVLLTPQIIDDSERAGFGYNYTPSRDARQLLDRGGFPTRDGNQ